MLVLSVAFVALLIVEEVTLPGDLGHGLARVGLAAIWVAFALEVIVLFALAPRKRAMLRDHWLDVIIVVVPFLRPLRIARLLRVVRAGGAVGRALRALQRVTSSSGVQAYSWVALVITVGSGLLVWLFERRLEGRVIDDPGDGLWWAITTVTTVGYGDTYPTGSAGRILSVVLMLVGIGLVGVVTANIAAFIVEEEQSDELAAIKEQLDRIEAALAGADAGGGS